MDIGRSGGKVVSIEGFHGAMRFPFATQVRAYWEALRAGRQVPLRSEIDPHGIESALEYAFVLERIAPTVARFRLAGMHLTDLMGMEVRGMPLTALFAPEARAGIASALQAVFEGPQMAELTLEAETGFGKPPLTARMLILPMRSDFGDISRALGCLEAHGPIGRAPRRFTISQLRMLAIEAGKTPAAATALPERQVQGFAEPAADYQADREVRRPDYLRLVRSED